MLCALAPARASALEQGADAETNERGVEVVITIGEDGEASARPRNGSGGDTCDWSVVQFPFTGQDPPARYGRPPSPEHRLYLVFCDGEFVAAQWLGPNGENAPAVDTEGLARTVIDNVPVDLFTIAVKPDARAVTGIPSYFWVEGYDGETITGSVSNGPVTVDVAIELGTVTWDFGDGTEPLRTTSLGDEWPERSEIRHAYRDRGTYTITVTIELPARFSVNGQPPTELEPVVRTSTLTYVVDEVQAVRTR